MGFLTPITVLSACIYSPTDPWGGRGGGGLGVSRVYMYGI